MNHLQKHLSASLIALAALLTAPVAAWAATAPALNSASGYAVLSVPPLDASGVGTGAVTCTSSTINGNVGSNGPATSVTQTGCTIGTVTAPVSLGVVTDFTNAYNALEGQGCDTVLTTLPTTPLSPGVYCFNAALTVTGSTLTLNGPSNGIWIFKIGTNGSGALTGTNFTVNMTGGGSACNVYWWVAQAATMTTSLFQGNILAGAAITTTGGTFAGRALAGATVTMTGTSVIGCDAALPGSLSCVVTPPPKLSCDTNHQHHKHCKLHDYDPPHCDGNDDGHDDNQGSSSSFPWSIDKH